MRTTRRQALTALLAGAAAAALVLASSAGASRAVAWETHTVPTSGFAVALPASWLDIGRRTPAVEARLSALEAKHPSAVGYLSRLRLGGRVHFIAVETSGASLERGFPTNLNVVKATTTISSFAVLEEAVVAELEQNSSLPIAGTIGHSIVRLPAGRAVKVRFSVHDYSAGQLLTVTQYVLLRGGGFYVLTYTTLSGQLARYKPTFERSARSFRFLAG